MIFKRSIEKVHVLHVVPGLGPGGMEIAMAQVISALSSVSFYHSIACLEGEPEIEKLLPANSEIFCFHKMPNDLNLPFRLARFIQKTKPDVIHARNWGAWPDTALGRLLAIPPRPFIYSFHGLGVAGYMPWRRRMASKILVHATTCLFTLSHQSRDMLVKYWGWPKNRTEIIPNGVDTNRFHPLTKTHNNRIVVGSVGNLRTVKNHALILEAVAQLVKKGIDLDVRIAGEGDQREPLNHLAQSVGLTDHLKLPGRIEDIPSFLNGLDIFVLSSDSEQHPNALNEAMACGVPSIATNVGCVEDLLDSGHCGIIIPPGDVKALEGAIRELVSNESLRKKYAKAGLQQVRANYSLDVMVERYRELYLRAAGIKTK
jgi:glycosyltransferase involved in cell wall biosynthesis